MCEEYGTHVLWERTLRAELVRGRRRWRRLVVVVVVGGGGETIARCEGRPLHGPLPAHLGLPGLLLGRGAAPRAAREGLQALHQPVCRPSRRGVRHPGPGAVSGVRLHGRDERHGGGCHSVPRSGLREGLVPVVRRGRPQAAAMRRGREGLRGQASDLHRGEDDRGSGPPLSEPRVPKSVREDRGLQQDHVPLRDIVMLLVRHRHRLKSALRPLQGRKSWRWDC
mmetsp:Transcript_61969/g.160757  ORF Transcript_61969/g.160757 Transcript_61969/m.160757 type:complete len:224 (-) Transcript_61969:337-1008(-)